MMTERQQASPPAIHGLQWRPVGKSARVCIADATGDAVAGWRADPAAYRHQGIIGIDSGKVIWVAPGDPPGFVVRLMPEMRLDR